MHYEWAHSETSTDKASHSTQKGHHYVQSTLVKTQAWEDTWNGTKVLFEVQMNISINIMILVQSSATKEQLDLFQLVQEEFLDQANL
jgi:hypothetical protein